MARLPLDEQARSPVVEHDPWSVMPAAYFSFRLTADACAPLEEALDDGVKVVADLEEEGAEVISCDEDCIGIEAVELEDGEDVDTAGEETCVLEAAEEDELPDSSVLGAAEVGAARDEDVVPAAEESEDDVVGAAGEDGAADDVVGAAGDDEIANEDGDEDDDDEDGAVVDEVDVVEVVEGYVFVEVLSALDELEVPELETSDSRALFTCAT